jgi:uncharacterized protein (TIGR03086 family)
MRAMTERHWPRTATGTIDELIAIGRDREAVDAAARDSVSDEGARRPGEAGRRGGPMDGAEQLDEIIPLIEGVVDRIRPDQLDAPTPCAAFTVTSILEHMVGGASAFAPAFRGEAPPDAGGPSNDALQVQFKRAMAELASAVHTPGAQERTIAAPFGEVPGSVFARFVAFDGIVHGWDLATATGQPYAPRDELVAEVEAFVREVLGPQLRDGDTFADEKTPPPDATPIERLAAFSGRDIPSR